MQSATVAFVATHAPTREQETNHVRAGGAVTAMQLTQMDATTLRYKRTAVPYPNLFPKFAVPTGFCEPAARTTDDAACRYRSICVSRRRQRGFPTSVFVGWQRMPAGLSDTLELTGQKPLLKAKKFGHSAHGCSRQTLELGSSISRSTANCAAAISCSKRVTKPLIPTFKTGHVQFPVILS